MLVNKTILALLLSKAGEKGPMYESMQKMWLAKLIFEKLLYFGKLVVTRESTRKVNGV
jgi:hypothetical protein